MDDVNARGSFNVSPFFLSQWQPARWQMSLLHVFSADTRSSSSNAPRMDDGRLSGRRNGWRRRCSMGMG